MNPYLRKLAQEKQCHELRWKMIMQQLPWLHHFIPDTEIDNVSFAVEEPSAAFLDLAEELLHSRYILNGSGDLLCMVGEKRESKERRFLGFLWRYQAHIRTPLYGELVGNALLRIGPKANEAAYLVSVETIPPALGTDYPYRWHVSAMKISPITKDLLTKWKQGVKSSAEEKRSVVRRETAEGLQKTARRTEIELAQLA